MLDLGAFQCRKDKNNSVLLLYSAPGITLKAERRLEDSRACGLHYCPQTYNFPTIYFSEVFIWLFSSLEYIDHILNRDLPAEKKAIVPVIIHKMKKINIDKSQRVNKKNT